MYISCIMSICNIHNCEHKNICIGVGTRGQGGHAPPPQKKIAQEGPGASLKNPKKKSQKWYNVQV